MSASDPREEAARRAAEGNLEALDSAIRAAHDAPSREFAACWVQEALLRGAALGGRPCVEALWRRLQEEGHPLGQLPLSLTDAEASARSALPVFGSDEGRAWSPAAPPSRRAPAHEWRAMAVRDMALSPDLASDLSAAVEGWVRCSNGRRELRLLDVVPPLPGLDASILRAVGLASLRGATEIASEPIDPAGAFRILLGAAANGGAYGGALQGAFGRLAAWRSLGALAGVPPSAPIESILDEARRCEWLYFFAPGWFCYVAWDLGLAALRPGGRRIAVLAATDQD